MFIKTWHTYKLDDVEMTLNRVYTAVQYKVASNNDKHKFIIVILRQIYKHQLNNFVWKYYWKYQSPNKCIVPNANAFYIVLANQILLIKLNQTSNVTYNMYKFISNLSEEDLLLFHLLSFGIILNIYRCVS